MDIKSDIQISMNGVPSAWVGRWGYHNAYYIAKSFESVDGKIIYYWIQMEPRT